MEGGRTTSARILIVDDEPANVRLLERLLAAAGYAHIERTTDPRSVLDLYRGFQPDLVLLDLMMPHLDGAAVLEQLRAEIPATSYVPILVLSVDDINAPYRWATGSGTRSGSSLALRTVQVDGSKSTSWLHGRLRTVKKCRNRCKDTFVGGGDTV